MKRSVIISWAVLLALTTLTNGSPVPLSRAKRVEKYTGKVNDLKQKLVQLQKMLEEINDGKKNKNSDKENIRKKPATPIGLERASREPMESANDNEANRSRQEKLKLLAARLVDGDRKSLKILENALADIGTEGARQSATDKDTTGEELGGFEESAAGETPGRLREADDTTRNDGDVERDILALLRNFREQSRNKPRDLDQDGASRHRPHQTIEEGHFGDFRQEVLHAVENRLLDDLKMALHSGFTVKEVINDLEATDGELESSKKREIEQELDTLKSLRENV